MKRFIFFIMLMALWVTSAAAQSDTAHLNFDYVSGMGIMDFISENSGTLITIAGLLIAEFVLGKTSAVKANSTIEIILNFVLKLFSKK